MAKKQLYIVDGSSFLYRAYHALRPMHTPSGITVHAVFGFCRMIKKLLDTRKPDYLVIAWDSKGTTPRHELLPSYKAKRLAAPQDLFSQKLLIQRFADDIGIVQAEQSGVEADDLMYSLALQYAPDVARVVLVTTDKDLGQVVRDNIILYDAFKEEELDRAAIVAKHGVPPEQLPAYFGLIGDASDNIPGVAGIGPKTAQQLLQTYGSLDGIYGALESITPLGVREKLRLGKDAAYLSEKLFTLVQYEMPLRLSDATYDPHQWVNARSLFEELNFASLLKGMGRPKPKGTFAERTGVICELVTTAEALRTLCDQISRAGVCAIDTETDGFLPTQASLVGISVCYEGGRAYYLPVGHTTGEQQLTRDEIMQFLKPLFEDARIAKYMQHAKYDLMILGSYGIAVQGLVFDTMVAASLVMQEGDRIGLKYLSLQYLKQEMTSFSDVMKQGSYDTFADVPLAQALDYAAADAHQTFQLVAPLRKALQEQQQEELFATLEMPLIHILLAMERVGIPLDHKKLAQLSDTTTAGLVKLRTQIVTLVGEQHADINLNSPKQLEQLLFHELRLTPGKKTAGRTGYSTDSEVLQELARLHPVPGLILLYRELFKLKSTYLDALPTFVNPKTGCVHTSFSQTTTATGRLASSDPNMQNIPVAAYDGISLRSVFPAPEGSLFLSADYSQIELRVLAYLSQDKTLLDAFARDLDVHAMTAARLFDVAEAFVTHEQRQVGKRINFSILYGLTPYGLSKDLGIPLKDAKRYIEIYFAQYPDVSAWMERVIEETREKGYVTTWAGRRRHLPGIHERNKSLYELACRVAINTKAQGTAAEIVKIGMLRLDALLREKKSQAHQVLQIHDELLLTVPHEELDHLAPAVKNLLESVVDWNVPLKVSLRTGADWGAVTK